jgi:hypothetical protein
MKLPDVSSFKVGEIEGKIKTLSPSFDLSNCSWIVGGMKTWKLALSLTRANDSWYLLFPWGMRIGITNFEDCEAL